MLKKTHTHTKNRMHTLTYIHTYIHTYEYHCTCTTWNYLHSTGLYCCT